MLLRASSGRLLVLITVAVATLAIASVVVTLVTGSSDPDPLAPDTPEGTVQRYLAALQERDITRAYDLLGDDLKEECSTADFRRSTRSFTDSDARVRLEGTRTLSDSTEVTVDVTHFYGSPPFEVRERTSTYLYVLEETDDGWRFVEEPWPYFSCPPKGLPEIPARPPP